MIEGYVSQVLEPVIEIGLSRAGTLTNIPAVVDTGFSGHVCLSEQYLEQIDLTFRYVERYELADGAVVVKDVFRGTIVFDEERREVNVILTASQDTLIGSSLLDGRRLTVDYLGRRVRIE